MSAPEPVVLSQLVPAVPEIVVHSPLPDAPAIVVHSPHMPAAVTSLGSLRSRSEVIDGDQMFVRLANMRAVVPVFARELVSARHQATSLRAANGLLLELVRQMQRESLSRRRRGGSTHPIASTGGPSESACSTHPRPGEDHDEC